MGNKQNYRRYIRRHLDMVTSMLDKQGQKVVSIAIEYESDHPEIATPLYSAGLGVKTIIDVIAHVKTLI